MVKDEYSNRDSKAFDLSISGSSFFIMAISRAVVRCSQSKRLVLYIYEYELTLECKYTRSVMKMMKRSIPSQFIIPNQLAYKVGVLYAVASFFHCWDRILYAKQRYMPILFYRNRHYLLSREIGIYSSTRRDVSLRFLLHLFFLLSYLCGR